MTNKNFEVVGVVAEGHHRRFHSTDVSVVIGPPYVDEQVAAGVLVAMIRNVRHEICVLTITLDEGSVTVVDGLFALWVDETAGPQPGGGGGMNRCITTSFLRLIAIRCLPGFHRSIGVITVLELSQRCLHRPTCGNRPFGGEGVELDIHTAHRGLLVGQRLGVSPLKRLVNVESGWHFPGPIDDVLTLITTVRHRFVGLASEQREREFLHLNAAIVYVELTMHVVSSARQCAGEGVAIRRPSGMTSM